MYIGIYLYYIYFFFITQPTSRFSAFFFFFFLEAVTGIFVLIFIPYRFSVVVIFFSTVRTIYVYKWWRSIIIRAHRLPRGDVFMPDWRIWILTSNDSTADLFLRLFHLFAIVSSRTWCPTLACNRKRLKKLVRLIKLRTNYLTNSSNPVYFGYGFIFESVSHRCHFLFRWEGEMSGCMIALPFLRKLKFSARIMLMHQTIEFRLMSMTFQSEMQSWS